MANPASKTRPSTMKTYSKRVNISLEDKSKKRKRSEALPENEFPTDQPKVTRRSIQDYFKPKQITPPSPSSSIILKQLSSDPVESAATPPSSPPLNLSGSIQKFQKRPKRRLSARPHVQKPAPVVSSSDCENEESAFKNAPTSAGNNPRTNRAPLKSVAPNLQQAQLDLGVSAMKKCKECGMEYNSTIPEDRKLHDDYHKKKLNTTQPKMLLKHLSKSVSIHGETYEIRSLDSRGPVQARLNFEQALDTMYGDLSGDQITSDDLWSEMVNPLKSSVMNKVPRFTVSMLLFNLAPVAIIIVERISKGGGYLDDFRSSQSEPNIAIGERSKAYGKPDVVKAALMSVERIWVAKGHRRKGLATTLINHSRKVLIPGLEIRRSQVAFSWPTTLGRSLATRYSMGQHDEAIPFLVNLADFPDV